MNEQAGLAPDNLPSPEAIRNAAEAVLRNPKYKLDDGGAYDLTPILERILHWLGRLLSPLARAFGAIYDFSPLLYWVTLLLLLAGAVALMVHIGYALFSALRLRRRALLPAIGEDNARGVPETWERRAREALAAGDFIGAIRCLFRASVLRLERARKRAFRRAATNHEYLRSYGDTPAAAPLRVMVEAIDVKWYGGKDCSKDDYEQCAQAHALIRELAGGTADAQRA